ncbi:MAG: CBM9 family sugar-binding protein [Oscillospiraceae bacterium]|nr:CBM9 family sugar-binding protein [Oscillospiraceae bacterium]
MKKLLAAILLISVIAAIAVVPVSAQEPAWIFECPKLVIPVEINGDGQGWDDAGMFIANNDNPIFQQYGIWQGNADMPIPSSDLSVEYRLKWDETYFYILEKRFDKNHVVFSDIHDAPENAWPWMHSGTLFFLNYDANFADPTRDGCYEVFWVNNGETLVMTGRHFNKTQMFADDPEMEGILIAGSRDGDTYITEVAVPWATMRTVSGFPAPSEGLKLRMTPVASAFNAKTDDIADRFQGHIWNQLNFYTDPEVAGPDDPISNGGMILTAATYTPPAADEPAADDGTGAGGGDPAEVPAPAPAPAPVPAPQTGDAMIFTFAALLLAGLAGAVLVKSRVRI